MPAVLRIKDWDRCFENSSSRKLIRMTWVAVPLKHGTGFRRLIALEDGAALYGAWMALVTFAATCPIRGTFARVDGKAYSASDIAIVTGFPTKLIQRCIETVSQPDFEIEWIDSVEWENLPKPETEAVDSPGEEAKNGTTRETSGDDGRKASAQNRTKTKNNKTETESVPDQSTKTQPPPPKNIPSAPDVQASAKSSSDDSQATWGLVAGGLKKFGLARVQEAIGDAKRSGFSAAQIIDWLAWLNDSEFPLRKEKIGPGAIIERIRTEDALHWEPGFGWPPTIVEPVASSGEQLIAQRQDEQRKRDQADEDNARRQREYRQAIEGSFGTTLDAMTHDEVLGLAAGNDSLIKTIEKLGPKANVVRMMLLEKLAEKQNCGV